MSSQKVLTTSAVSSNRVLCCTKQSAEKPCLFRLCHSPTKSLPQLKSMSAVQCVLVVQNGVAKRQRGFVDPNTTTKLSQISNAKSLLAQQKWPHLNQRHACELANSAIPTSFLQFKCASSCPKCLAIGHMRLVLCCVSLQC
jgi:hypothetical protein